MFNITVLNKWLVDYVDYVLWDWQSLGALCVSKLLNEEHYDWDATKNVTKQKANKYNSGVF